jgi:type II secretory ATPase GspE/PulE/Tfp pilus assembly ATPase PilB-like protein
MSSLFGKASVRGASTDGLDKGTAAAGADVLSRSGLFEASEEQRKLLVLLPGGSLMVAHGQAQSPQVLSYLARLDKLGYAYTLALCSVDTIAAHYRSGGAEPGQRRQEYSMMQVTAKELLNQACRERASDIHIRVRRSCTEILFRIHNDLEMHGSQTVEYGERLLATLYGAMASVSDSSYKPTERQDASIADRDKLPAQLHGVRIATAPTNEGTVMVLRLLYNDAGDNLDLRLLGFSEQHAAHLQRLKEHPVGMNIISGPTGSGKSTTLQRVLSGLIQEAHAKLHVLTVEDPVEYPIEGAVQTSVVNADTESERARLFSGAIANALRLDPDTIMIGEIRDGASAHNALRAAMTGHQVWTTVHANSALAIVDRLVDLGLPLSMVCDPTLITGLISQRLVKQLCPHCKVRLINHQNSVVPAALARWRAALADGIETACLAGPGCVRCRQQGTTGRSVLAEVIAPDQKFFELVRAGHKAEAAVYARTKLGSHTMLEHALSKVAAGLVDPRMAEKVVGHLIQDTPGTERRLSVVEVAHA